MFDQPDLFAATPEDLRKEISRYGGGTPPRWIAPAPDEPDPDEVEPFSPVSVAEAYRARERAAEEAALRERSQTVRLRVIPVDRRCERLPVASWCG